MAGKTIDYRTYEQAKRRLMAEVDEVSEHDVSAFFSEWIGEPVEATINWPACGDQTVSWAREFAGWILAAADLAEGFEYAGWIWNGYGEDLTEPEN